jgi:hypothetical protein
MPTIHRNSLIWLILTFSTNPSKTTIQIAIDSNQQLLGGKWNELVLTLMSRAGS